MDDLYNVESFGYDELLSIGFLMSARCAYSRKYCKKFCTNLWVDFSLIWKYQEETYSALPQKYILHKPLFWYFPDLEISRIFDPAPQIGHIEMFSYHFSGNYY